MNETLGQVIAQRRQEMDMTQRELARNVGISNSTVSRIEGTEEFTPDTKTLRAIANVLHIDYNYLLALSGQVADEPEIRMIQRAARNMSDDDKKKMMNALEAFFSDAFKNAGDDTHVSPIYFSDKMNPEDDQ